MAEVERTIGPFGRLTTVRCGDSTYIFSIVRWGFFRKIIARVTKASPYPFIPTYEVVVYRRIEGRIDLSSPLYVYHFAKKQLLEFRIKTIVDELQSSGEFGDSSYLPNQDPSQEGIYRCLYDREEDFLNEMLNRRR